MKDSNRTILLVEDEVITALAEAQTIQQFGYEVVIVNSGEKAVELSGKNEVISLILMDIDLGKGLDGPEAAQQILAKRNIPIVFLTSHSKREMVEKVRGITRYGYVIKNSGNFVLQSSIEMAFELFDAHQKTIESEERLHKAEIIAGFGNWEFNLNEKTVTASEGAKIIYGLGQVNWIIAEVQKIPLPKYRFMLDAALSNLVEKSIPYDVEFEIARPSDGKRIYIHSIAKYDRERNVVIGIIHDITERKLAEQAQRESEEKMRAIYHAIPIPTYTWKAVNDDFLLTDFNNAALKFTGDQVTNLVGIKASKMYRDNPEILGIFAQCFREKTSIEREMYYSFRTSGRHRYLNVKYAFVPPDMILVHTEDITERRRAEDLLRNTQQRLENIISNLYAGILFVSEDGKIEHINQAFCDMHNFSEKPADLRELTSAQMIIKVADAYESPPKFSARIKEIITQGKPVMSEEFATRDSRQLIVDFIPLVVDGQRVGRIWHYKDVTEHKQVVADLRKSEEQYRILFENAAEGILIYDSTLTITNINRRACEISGYDSNDFIGKNFLNLGIIHPDDYSKAVRNSSLLLSGKPIGKSRYRLIRKDGRIIVCDLNGAIFRNDAGDVVSVITIMIDVTEQVDAEEDLKLSEGNYREIFNASNDAIFVHDVRGTILDVNKTMCNLFEYSHDEAVRLNVRDISLGEHPYSQEEAEKLIAAVFEKGPQLFEWQCRRKNGALFWADVSLKQAVISGQERVLAFVRDITEQKQAEEKIKSLLAEKEIILKEVHHRIKNNMSTISSLLSLQAGTLTEPSAISALHDAKSRVDSMGVLYDKLYRSENPRAMSIKDYLPPLVDEIVANFPNSKSVSIKKKFDDFVLDAKRLQPLGMIINETITNIMKHAFTGESNGLISVSATLNGDHVSLVIQDNGKGMPEFIDFENSTGFGLMLVGQLTNQLRGTVRIERKMGTRIILEFDI